MLEILFAAVAVSVPPPPDPYPGSVAPISWVAYDYDLPAVDADTGEVIPSVYFHCHVPVKWHGTLNRRGHAVCKLVPRL